MPLVTDKKDESTLVDFALLVGFNTGDYTFLKKLNYTAATLEKALLQAFLQENIPSARQLIAIFKSHGIENRIPQIRHRWRTDSAIWPVDPETEEMTVPEGSLLHLAVALANEELIHLAQTCNMDMTDFDNIGHTPVFWLAFIAPQVEVPKIVKTIQALVACGANLMDRDEENEYFVLGAVVATRKQNVLQAFITLQNGEKGHRFCVMTNPWDSSPYLSGPSKRSFQELDRLNCLYTELVHKSCSQGTLLNQSLNAETKGEVKNFHASIILHFSVKKGHLETAIKLLKLCPDWINLRLNNHFSEEELVRGDTPLHTLLRTFKVMPSFKTLDQRQQNYLGNLLRLFSILLEAGARLDLMVDEETQQDISPLQFMRNLPGPISYLLERDFFRSMLIYHFSLDPKFANTPDLRFQQTLNRSNLSYDMLSKGMVKTRREYFDEIIPVIAWMQLMNKSSHRTCYSLVLHIASFLPCRLNPEYDAGFLKYVARKQEKGLTAKATRMFHATQRKLRGEQTIVTPAPLPTPRSIPRSLSLISNSSSSDRKERPSDKEEKPAKRQCLGDLRQRRG